MTNFHCRKCGSSVQGTGPERHWLCSKCRNAALSKELQEIVANENENDDRDIEDTNKGLLKLIKKLKGFVEAEDSSESEKKSDNEPNNPDYTPSSVSKEISIRITNSTKKESKKANKYARTFRFQ